MCTKPHRTDALGEAIHPIEVWNEIDVEIKRRNGQLTGTQREKCCQEEAGRMFPKTLPWLTFMILANSLLSVPMTASQVWKRDVSAPQQSDLSQPDCMRGSYLSTFL